MKRIIWAGLFLLGYVTSTLATGFVSYLPMSNDEYAKKRAQRHLLTMPAPGEITPGQRWHFRQVGVAGATLEQAPEEADEWRMTGNDRAGKTWSVPLEYLHNAAGNAHIYRADLDRNEIQDLIVWKGNAGLGLGPTAKLIIITFKTDGRPCVWESWGFYTVSGAGVEDLLDLQGNGRAQLLDMQFSDGYWVTDLYQVKEAHWQRVNGWFGQLHYPALSRFTYRPNRKWVKKPGAGRNPETGDLAAGQRCL